MQSNWPTAAAPVVVGGPVGGGTVGGGTVGAMVVGGLVVDVVEVDVEVVEVVEVEDVEVDDVEEDEPTAVVGGLLDVGAGAVVPSTEPLAGADDSVRDVHPAAANASVSTRDVTIEVF